MSSGPVPPISPYYLWQDAPAGSRIAAGAIDYLFVILIGIFLFFISMGINWVVRSPSALDGLRIVAVATAYTFVIGRGVTERGSPGTQLNRLRITTADCEQTTRAQRVARILILWVPLVLPPIVLHVLMRTTPTLFNLRGVATMLPLGWVLLMIGSVYMKRLTGERTWVDLVCGTRVLAWMPNREGPRGFEPVMPTPAQSLSPNLDKTNR